MTDHTQLVKWLYGKLDETGWTITELARRAQLSHVAISNVLNGKRNPGPKFCLGVAYALRTPADYVFKLAGLLTPVMGSPPAATEETELLDYFRVLTPENRNVIISLARTLHEQHPEYAKGKPRKGNNENP